MIYTLIVSFVTLFVLWFSVKKYKFRSHLKCFPTTKGWPIVGVLPDFLNLNDAVYSGMKLINKFGPNMLVTVGIMEALVLTEPKFNEIVLGSNKLIEKAGEYKLAKSVLGEGLLTSSGAKWRSRRKILTPAFHYNILKDFVKVFEKSSDKLVEKLSVELEKKSFDIYRYITLHTLDVICETAMGTPVNAQDDENSLLVKSVKGMCELLYSRLFSTITRIDFIYKLTPTWQEEKRLVKVLNGFSDHLIRQGKAAASESNGTIKDTFGMKSKHTFLDILLMSTTTDGQPLSHEDIREEVNTFMFEGHDTTSVALCFCIHSLSKHKDIQDKVFEEVSNIMNANKSPDSSYENLLNMKYLEMVLKESMRLYPSVPIFARKLTEDTKFDGGMLPKGLLVALAPYATHRNPNLYPDPEKFIPERFSPENNLKRHPYAYIPFSAGPRNCIGQKFAMLELKMTIAKLLMRYEILPAYPEHNLHHVCKVTLQSANGFHVQLKERM